MIDDNYDDDDFGDDDFVSDFGKLIDTRRLITSLI